MKSVALLAAAVLAATPQPAWGADPPQTYVVPMCSTGSGPQPLSGWVRLDAFGANECEQGRGFGADTRSAAYIQWTFGAPTDTRIAGVRIWRAGQLEGAAYYTLVARTLGRATPTLEYSPDLRGGAVNGRAFGGLDADALQFSLQCLSECGNSWVRFYRMEMVLRDIVNPRVTGVGESAIGGGALSGTVTVRTSFADNGGGVRQVSVLVDGGEYVRGKALCSQPYAFAVPCPLSGTQELEIDTRGLADGEHTLTFELEDVAGNRSISRPYEVWVRNAPDPPVVTPAPEPLVRLVAEWSTLTATYNKTTVVRARARDVAGNPLAGVKVGVAVRPAIMGAPFVLDTPVFSDSQGRITVKLPKGTSREVRLTHGDQTTTIKVVVKAPLQFSASPAATRNHKSIRLSGSVPGTDAATDVELQARDGTKWIPFKTVRLHNGRFSARYRFMRTFQTTRYRFRAVIHGDSRFPYAPASSRVASVLVRP
ncbi:Ig-like domain-containing protein [Solirubrobacter ginsenosidimutans]|uniref:Ig-like domain-containing protein n=1 Tax=Solirubrobacter ginsenosidimutans TaxID=490573 RepID=A0A9X3RZN8_9ACTN|nr:Ig-like domain-containing protein [Solirubrobacter ginsenosidimutans]MDA0159137.1 Ig-like domain-containing protein [Solirubrobacter ginsenosidimutans]